MFSGEEYELVLAGEILNYITNVLMEMRGKILKSEDGPREEVKRFLC
jgi:hypothetical protein